MVVVEVSQSWSKLMNVLRDIGESKTHVAGENHDKRGLGNSKKESGERKI